MKSPEQVPGQKYSPEQKERIKYVLEIADRDLSSPSLAGYHGTGIASLKLLIETGKLFGRPLKGNMADSHGIGNKGDLHFYPRAAGFPKDFNQYHLGRSLGNLTEKKSIEYATDYARDASERDIFMELAGLDQSIQEHRDLFYEFSSGKDVEAGVNLAYDNPEAFKDVLDIAEKLKLSRNNLIDILKRVQEETLSRKGLIFGLDQKLLDKYKIKSGDEGDDLFINCPDGLDYKDVCGLRALGKTEKEFLANLRTKI
jgi:hypothetical protein